jgi:hypothetical protein
LAIGAAVENMCLAALERGFSLDVAPFPRREEALVCDLELSALRAPPAPAELALADAIEQRSTQRQVSERIPMKERDPQSLNAAAHVHGAKLQLLTSLEALAEIGNLVGSGDRLRFLNDTLSREMLGELRWSAGEAERTRDGIDLRTLDLSPADSAGLRLLRSPEVAGFLRKIGGGKALENMSQRAITSASAVGLLTIDGESEISYFRGGRALSRLWLTATVRGLAIQPMSALPYLFARLARSDTLPPEDANRLYALRKRYEMLFDLPPNTGELLLFRLMPATTERVRSLRRPLDEVLSFAWPKNPT